MGDETVYTRTTRRAIEAAGGEAELSRALDTTVEEVRRWLSGRSVPPDKAFLLLLEIVSRRRSV
jgi:DNA-binding transcriptional regulator YiaG